MVELGQLREASGLGEHEPDDFLAPRAEDLSSQARKDCPQDGLEGELLARQLGTDGDYRCTDPGADERLEQRLLRREVKIDRTLGDARPRSHILEPRLCEAALPEDIEGGVEDQPFLGLPIGIVASAERWPARCPAFSAWPVGAS